MAMPAIAQDEADASLSADELEYYLVQAFQASTAEARIALNHIGIETQSVDGGFLVTAALENYPAHQAGIERGDKILRIDGEPFHPVYSFNTPNTTARVFSPETASHRLEFERDGTVEAVEIVPVFENLYDSYRTATLGSVQKFSLGNKTIAYIRFWGLSRSTSDLFTLQQLMRDFTDSDGMIVDLRNSYGFLSSEHLDLFTRNGRGYFEASSTANRHAAITQSFSPNSDRSFGKPIVVLINSQTRAGSELMAYGLAKLDRITTIGEDSQGRIGTYTQGGDSLHYNPAEQLLIDGESFESVGVTPKVSILFPFTQTGRSDPQFEASIDFLLGRI